MFFCRNNTILNMNLQEIKARLDKLQRYYEFLAASADKISTLDRDALLAQLRDLYDVVLSSSNVQTTTVIAPVVEKEPVVEKTPEVKEVVIPVAEEPKKEEPVKKTPKLVFTQTEQPETKKEEPVQVVIEPVKEEPKAEVKVEPVKETPVIVEPVKEVVNIEPQEEFVQIVIEPVKEEPKAEVKVEPIKEEPKVETKVEPVKVVEPPKEEPKKVEETASFNEEYDELFQFKQATDLAAKLSESPIANLNKALGVNEKLYYINALFGGDVAKFNDAIVFFNDAGLLEKARAYMEEKLIDQLAWMSKEKKPIAKEFVKLVRRRYL